MLLKADNKNSQICLRRGDVQIWQIPLAVPLCSLPALQRCLSEEEIKRANRYQMISAKRRFIVRRAGLRHLLGNVLSVRAESVHIETSKFGKPFLDNQTNDEKLHFSLSNSRDLALVALSRTGEIGIDVEAIRSIAEAFSIARRMFAVEEISTLQSMSAAQQKVQFLKVWCRHESLLKAIGCGFLDQNMHPGAQRNSAGSNYFFQSLTPASGFVGALCSSFRPTRIIASKFNHA